MLFDYDADALAAKLMAAIRDGIAPPAAAEAQEETARRWIGGFERRRSLIPPAPAPEGPRKLVAIVDGDEKADLAATLASLTATDFEAIVLIDRGRSEAVPAPDHVVRVAPARPNVLLDLIGQRAGEAFLLVRAGVALLPGAAAHLADALCAPEPDGVIPAVSIGLGDDARILPPLGGSPSFCLYEGATPGGVVAVKAERLAAAAAGRRLPQDSEHLGLADLAIATGLELWPLAEVLARHSGGLIEESGNRRATERVAAYAATPSPTERYYIAAIGYGRSPAAAGVATKLRGLREWMALRGLGWVVRAAYRIVPRPLLRRLGR
jgi:hypothetical protein